ncbi:MAG: NAD-dependent DNA ligase LigA [Lachnospiraceae bacterium]|jgi:DNA ligase (NAD+)|nr:NAD-dependent DNA ligase LigA [Lachnospiraceae bacterium]
METGVINNNSTQKKINRMKELISILDKAARAYYQGTEEIMSNKKYDSLYDELEGLEKETGIILSGSLTQKVGYEILSELPKKDHPKPMLSLNKTKSVDELASFAGDNKCLLSWKMDGLTVVLTYDNGSLTEALTRGNGITGEVITQNARNFKNIPLNISYKGHLVLRGEAVIPYSEFERINNEISDPEEQYKNPRNLCSGSVRQLDPNVTRSRGVYFFAFALVDASENGIPYDFHNSQERRFLFLKDSGFTVVHYEIVNKNNMHEKVKWFSQEIEKNDFPSDGLVLLMDDISFGESLGTTAKFPRNAIAFKWRDETKETILRDVIWNASRTGLINPVAVFDPVSLEGTVVTRASVHNVSIVRELKLGIGDHINVYKANMIIPQISEDLTGSGDLAIPDKCPVCGALTVIREDHESEVLTCPNPECPAKKIKSFSLFVSRDAMNIEGLSENTIEKLIDIGAVHDFADLFRLDRYKEKIISMEGFGEKAFLNLQNAVKKSQNAETAHFIAALGIPGVGLSTARLICRNYHNDMVKIMSASADELQQIDGIGDITARDLSVYFHNDENKALLNELLSLIHFTDTDEEAFNADNPVHDAGGLTFVITGSLNHFSNRNELKDMIVKAGGSVTGSVSRKTDFLINNDAASTSSKNTKAHELGIPIITEEEFMQKFM